MGRPGLITNEVGFRGPVTTQRPLTQGNKVRESKDQLHKVIWQIIDNNRWLYYST